LWWLSLCWSFAQHDGITNVIIRAINNDSIQWLTTNTTWGLLFSIGYWIGFLLILFIISMIIWNIVDAIRGKEDKSLEVVAINQLTCNINQLTGKIYELIKMISKDGGGNANTKAETTTKEGKATKKNSGKT